MDHLLDINEAYHKLSVRADMLYEFVMMYHNYIYNRHSYEKEQFNMLEIHILSYIDDSPGVTSTELAKIWHKSKSAISQVIKKLIDREYIEKRYKDGNEKSAFLYVTERGRHISSIHKAYDVADITQTTAYLIEQCSAEDLDAFYRILGKYNELLKSELEQG
ncbi:MAG: MarR family transcriptional regulator [Lachnospiraceae bacterium]|nr:MarR family transcriptional regulator [Lachnospiraceae bacterium]